MAYTIGKTHQAYIHKIVKHDVTHQYGITGEIVADFFGGNLSPIFFRYDDKKREIPYYVDILTATDNRFSATFVSIFERDKANIGDLLFINKLQDGKYTLKVIKSTDREYELLNSVYFIGNDRHNVIVSEQIEESSEVESHDIDTSLSQSEYSYISAIKTKPFLILGGFSGTGKSQKVKELAFATCPNKDDLQKSETSPGNYLLVSVKPNWHDATDIVGFRSSVNRNYYVTDFMRFLVKAKLYEKDNIPFFVCLDEMNLAPVEEYFADFLSVIESRKKTKSGRIVTDPLIPASVFNATDYDPRFNIFMSLGLDTIDSDLKADEYCELPEEDKAQAFVNQDIVEELKENGLTIPQNVIIIGTVNMDDTTNSFSRKVIDRAMTFETIVGIFTEEYFDSGYTLRYSDEPWNGKMLISDEVRATDLQGYLNEQEKTDVITFINNINIDLDGTPFKISYRILNETILLYRAKKEVNKYFKLEEVQDLSLNQVFDDILMQKVLPRIEGDYEKCNKCLTALSIRADENNWKQSLEKIEFMIKRFGSDKSGFTSFWN